MLAKKCLFTLKKYAKILDKNYTMLNYIEGEQLYYFVLLTKLNTYGAIVRKRLLKYWFLGIVLTKSLFSQKVLRKYEQKICHFLSLEKWFTMTYSMTP